MAADEPPYLTIGTDVSAKYKGAFCEAKIKKVNRVVKCKVTFKNNLGSCMITDDQIKGSLRIGAEVDAKHPDKGQFMEAVINKLQDYSQYTVVFDDGDETTLRRTSLCLKSGRHFAESPTLDQFPLTNPEHFGTPVIGSSKFKRKRRSTMNSALEYESSDDESIPRKVRAIRNKEQNPDLGKVVCVDYGDRRKKENWYPGLIVPHPTQSNIKITKEEHLIRSFKDGKYYQVPKRDIREFVKDAIQKVENNLLRLAVEKANNYLEKDELPPHWEKALFAGLESQSADEESHDSDSDTSDDEPSEEKDRFVAQLYKFMDERGTPINKAPVVSNRDLNLYKLFRIMHKLGGYNKVTNKNKWKVVYSRMGLPQSNLNGPNQIKVAYKRFLQSFEDFYRKLGCTMVSNSRSTRGRHRSDRNIMVTRTREKDTASPKARNAKDAKEKPTSEKKVEDKPKTEKKETKPEETGKIQEKPKTPEKKRAEKPSNEEKDEKRKKEEKDKPRLVRLQSLTKEKKETKLEKARTREDARKEKNESPEKKGTRSSSKAEPGKKEKEENTKDKKDKSPKEKDKKEEKSSPKDLKEEKPKLKKDDKIIRERKILREKKSDEKSPKEKRENPPREKRERDSSKEDRGSPKVKKEELKAVEDKTPKKKVERPTREKTEEKSPRIRLEDKAAAVEASKKLGEESELKSTKEEKPIKNELDVKKDEPVTKEKLRSKLRERKEDTASIGEETAVEGPGDVEETDKLLLDGLEKKPIGSKLKIEEGEEPPNKGKKRSFKSDDKDDKESLQDLSDSDESFTNDSEKNFGKEIDVGDKVKVKYGRGRLQKVYEAKVLKIEMDGPDKRYYVHYAGWNTRYDEWVKKSYIVANISNIKQKSENNSKSSSNLKKVERGRPPGLLTNTKLDRKNSTSSSSSRATRSEKKGSLPLSGGLEPKKRTRRKSGTTTSATDVSQESDTDGVDLMDLDDDDGDSSAPPNSSCFKEELFSDDEEKEKMEDAKRGDITELEKAISVEEGGDDIKGLYFSPVVEDKKTVKEEDVVSKIQDESHLIKDNNTLSDMSESQDKLLSKTEDKPAVSVEESVISQTDLKYPLVSLADINTEKIPELTLGRNNVSVGSYCAVGGGKSLPPQVLTSNENKAALSFAGLIQKSTSESIVKAPLKTTVNKIATSENVTNFSSVIENSNLENKPQTDSMFRSISIFGSVLKSPQSFDSADVFEEKFVPKPASNLFNCMLKSENANNIEKLPSSVDGKDKPKSLDSLKVFEPVSDTSKFTHQESNKNLEVKKELESSSLRFCNSDNKDNDIKPKDKFDIMLQNTSSFSLNPQKIHSSIAPEEVKDNIFNFSFGSHNLPQEKPALDQLPSSSSSNNPLSRIQSKPSDTVDVSKMIPGILERLEKDVVADSKTSDSPLPPPKEELSFDFLRGSQSISKSLSRSDSSNSLRICESDTNDSNTDSKDVVTGEKLEMPVIVPPEACSNSLEEKQDIIDISKSASETNLSNSSSGSIPDIPKEEVNVVPVTSQPASVITAANVAPVLEIPPSPEKNKEIDALKIPVLPQESVTSPKDSETQPPEPDNLSKDDIPEVLCTKVSPTSLDVVKQVKPEVLQKEPIENLPDVTIKSEKEELFEEIKTIANFAQSSVIKCAPNSAEAGKVSESKSPVLVKEESLPEIKQEPKEAATSNISGLDAIVNAAAMKDVTMSTSPEVEAGLDSCAVADESSAFSQIGKKDIKRKKLGKKVGKKLGSSDVLEKEDKDLKMREGKTKSKKRLRLENNEGKSVDLKSKSKKLKKNKNKKRFSRHEDEFGEVKKNELRDDDHRDSVSDKIKKKEKKRSEKKFLKCGMKHEEFLEGKSELCKKKKNRKNREKLANDKKDIFEKKTKKKRKHMEDNQDTDSEKETLPKLVDKKRKKERKKFKVKDCSSSDETNEKPFKEKVTGTLLRHDSKSDDPDMSFLLCEEKVPASPADVGDESSGSSSNEEGSRLNSGIDLLPSVYPCCSRDPSNNLHKHSIDNVLDNTPPTTPSSTESLLSSSPSHERDSFPINYPESTQSGEGESDLFHCNSNRTVARGSEEYRAATTLAFAVCKSVSEKPKEEATNAFVKSPLSKRKKKRVQRYSESTKSPKHKSSYSRTSKVESYCEDSSGTSPATSSSPPYTNMSFRSLSHRLSDTSTRYFYVPLHEKDPEKRIAVLQEKMAALRKKYMALRAEVIAIDHKRRKARKKVKDSGGGVGNPSVPSEDGQSCS
ncbi:AT-rich interactive domain-containing protein 4B [Nephila pilipes]|uniref:AT-rich interactive domain-containing protein 4B n=1 Tax=Nephila pilipes TaxID=299642 RepID=A0A8X6PHG5_NEPPI|nr:AT-rich interactive domain-containing protein 4B [Nephila pilipes]